MLSPWFEVHKEGVGKGKVKIEGGWGVGGGCFGTLFIIYKSRHLERRLGPPSLDLPLHVRVPEKYLPPMIWHFWYASSPLTSNKR